MGNLGFRGDHKGCSQRRCPGRIQLFLACVLALAGVRGANAQCYRFSSGTAASLTINITNLPAPTITPDGTGGTFYTYQLIAVAGNSASLSIGSTTYSLSPPTVALIQVDFNPLVTSLIMNVSGIVGTSAVAAQISLAGPTNLLQPAAPLPAVLPPASAWTILDILTTAGTTGSPTFTVDSITGCSGTVTPGGPGIAASANSLAFAYTIGGATPANQNVTITSTGSAFTFGAAAAALTGSNWLHLTPGSGTTPATLTASVTPTGLAAGNYRGTISIVASGTTNSPLSIDVVLTVTGGSGGGPGAGGLAITAGGVQNAAGYQNLLAPGGVFVVLGSAMGPASIVLATAPNYPTLLSGTSITFTPVSGGAAIDAKMIYTLDRQVAAELPSSTAPGTYAVRVTYNGQTSAPENVTVVARSFGIVSINSGGTGPAQSNIANVNGGISLVRFTSGSLAFNGLNFTLTPAHPGDILTLWGTGGGADPASDAGTSGGDQTAAGNFVVTVGGRQVTPLYAGTSFGFPGLWQVNFTLPADIAPDCFASVQVSAGGQTSNAVTVAIAPAGQSACVNAQLSPAALARLDAGGSIVFGAFAAAKVTADTSAGKVVQESVSGEFARFTAAEWALLFSGPRFDACTVYDRTYPVGGKDPSSPEAFLDAGANLPLSGPNVASGVALATVSTPIGPAYGTAPAVGTLVNGKYTLTGNGGSQVGPFSASVTFPTSFTVTNWDSITQIDRTQPLTLNWTGTGFDQVAILVNSATRIGSLNHIVSVNCTVPASPGTYTVPRAALALLQPVGASGANFGGLAVTGMSTATPFTANLVGGGTLDFSAFAADLQVTKNIAVQ